MPDEINIIRLYTLVQIKLIFLIVNLKIYLSLQKLRARKATLSKMGWSASKCRKVAEVLTVDYMSSEEDEDRNEEGRARRGPIKRMVRKLPWESARLSKYKRKLDEKYMEGCTRAQLRAMADVSRQNVNLSEREKPRSAPAWAIWQHEEGDASSTVNA